MDAKEIGSNRSNRAINRGNRVIRVMGDTILISKQSGDTIQSNRNIQSIQYIQSGDPIGGHHIYFLACVRQSAPIAPSGQSGRQSDQSGDQSGDTILILANRGQSGDNILIPWPIGGHHTYFLACVRALLLGFRPGRRGRSMRCRRLSNLATKPSLPSGRPVRSWACNIATL